MISTKFFGLAACLFIAVNLSGCPDPGEAKTTGPTFNCIIKQAAGDEAGDVTAATVGDSSQSCTKTDSHDDNSPQETP